MTNLGKSTNGLRIRIQKKASHNADPDPNRWVVYSHWPDVAWRGLTCPPFCPAWVPLLVRIDTCRRETIQAAFIWDWFGNYEQIPVGGRYPLHFQFQVGEAAHSFGRTSWKFACKFECFGSGSARICIKKGRPDPEPDCYWGLKKLT